jgi:competence protein ComEC
MHARIQGRDEPAAADHSVVAAWRMPPLLPWAVGVAAGIALDAWLALSPWACGVVMTLGAAGLLIGERKIAIRVALALAAGAALGAMLHHRADRTVPPDHIVSFVSSQPRTARVRGTVIDRPQTRRGGYPPFEPWLYREARTSCLLAVTAIETRDGWATASGKLRISVKEAALAPRAGSRVEAFGQLYRPRGPRNPGVFDWARFQRRRGVWVQLVCDNAESLRVLDGPDESRGWLHAVRTRARGVLHDRRLATGGPSVAVLDAMVLGRRAGIERKIERAFIDTGCAHYLAVSGFHVGLLALAVWWPARLLGIPKRATAGVVMLVVVAYALVADPRPPIVRATVMIVCVALAMILRRPRAWASALSLAALVLLIARPPVLFDVGFQLSFVTVIGIAGLQPVIADGLAWLRRWGRVLVLRERPVSPQIERIIVQHTPDHWWRRGIRWSEASLAVAVAAWLAALPIVVGGFGRVAVWGWLSSWMVFPLVLPVMVLGFLKIAAGGLIPPLGVALGWGLDPLVGLLLGLLDALAQLPAANLAVPPAPGWVIIAYYLLLTTLILYRRTRVTGRTVAGVAVLLAVVLAGWWSRAAPPDGVRITALAVGRGAATVVELPNGDVWLYDAGASGNHDPGSGVVLPYLHQRGIRQVTGIVLSHPNLDHFGGVPAIVDAIRCGPVYLAPGFATDCDEDSPCAALMARLAARAHPVRPLAAGRTLELGQDMAWEIHWPPADLPAGLAVNDTSLVMRLTWGESSVLFTGDIGHFPQEQLMQAGLPPTDVLMLPHHGAVEDNTAAFIDHVEADLLVRSSFVTMADSPRLREATAGRTVFNTADVGAVEIVLDGRGAVARGYVSSGKPSE